MGRLSTEQYQKLKNRYLELSAMLEVPGALGLLSVEESSLEDFVQTADGLLVPVGKPRVSKKHEQPLMSYNRNFSNILASQFLSINATDSATFGDDHINVKDEAGVIWGSTSYAMSWINYLSMGAPMNNDTKGVIVGTGTAAESFEDFALDSKISDGGGAGQLFYFAQPKPLITWSSGDRTWTITHERMFKNNDGSSITINEIAIVTLAYATNLQKYILILRDKLSSGVAIDSGKVARVTIEIETAAFPS